MCTDTARYARASTGLDVPLSFPFVRVMKEGKRRRRGKEEKGRRVKDPIDRFEKSKSGNGYPPSFHLSRRQRDRWIHSRYFDTKCVRRFFPSSLPLLPSFLATPPNTTPFIESFRGKISNVLASFLRSFLFHVHLFNEVFFLAPTVPRFFFSCLCPSRGQKENVISPACVISTTLWALASKRDRRSLPPSPSLSLSDSPNLALPSSFSARSFSSFLFPPPPISLLPFFFSPPSTPFFFSSFFPPFFLRLPLLPRFSLLSLVADDCCPRPLLPCSSLPMTRFTESPGVKRFMPRWATFIPARRRLRLRPCLKGTTAATTPPRPRPTRPPPSSLAET